MNYLVIEPVGTMEEYTVSPFSADGYYNADAGSAQDTLNKLLGQLPDLQKKVDDATTQLANDTVTLTNYQTQLGLARQAALDCDARRAQHSTGAGKNKACGNRDALYSDWHDKEIAVTTYTGKVNAGIALLDDPKNGLKKLLQDLKDNIDDATKKAKEALKSDPTYATQAAKLDAQTKLEQQRITAKNALAKSSLDASVALKNAQIASQSSNIKYAIGAVALIGILVGGWFLWKKYKKSKSA